jgi:hypothetical protein
MERQKADHRPHSSAIDGSQVIPDPPIDLCWISFPFLPASPFIINLKGPSIEDPCGN